jgi:hypothetical protein
VPKLPIEGKTGIEGKGDGTELEIYRTPDLECPKSKRILQADRVSADISIEIRYRITLLSQRIARQPSPRDRIVSAVLRQVESAVGVVEHAGIVEVGERRCALQCVAVSVVAKGGCARGAGKDAPHRADLVHSVVIGLRRCARNKLALGIVTARRGIAGAAGLTDAVAAPEIGCRRRAAAASGRTRDRGAAAQPVIREAGLLACLPRISDADQAIFGIPTVIALPV